ncbi:MAG: dienelactone hydrolase [Myxococcota bacterium]|jgi:dienelactone hydrolase
MVNRLLTALLVLGTAFFGCSTDDEAPVAATDDVSVQPATSAADTSTAPETKGQEDVTAEADNGSPDVDEPDPTAQPNTAAGCTPKDTVPSLDDMLAPGTFKVGERSETLTDDSRITPAHGLIPERAFRSFPITILYPSEEGWLGPLTPALNAPLASDAGPFPLLVHSHGFMSNRDEVRYMAEHLASRGWVVVLPEFPLTNLGTVGGQHIADLVNQPGDVSLAIDALLGWTLTPGHDLNGAVDPDRIAASGVSLGGLTTMLTTYHADLADSRIKAAATLAGPGELFAQSYFDDQTKPLMIIHGDIDAIIDYQTNGATVRERADGFSTLVTLAGGSHTGFAGAATFLDALGDNPDQVGCETIAGNLPEDGGFIEGLGGEAKGIIVPENSVLPCSYDELPPAMKAERHHALTIATMHACLNLALGTATEAGEACAFLNGPLAEQADVLVE